MNKILLLLLALFVIGSQTASSQQEIATSMIDISTEKSIDWEVYFENLDFKIEYKFVNCDPSIGYDNESVLFRITNLTSEKLTISWISHIYYDKICKTCNYPDEYFNELSMTPNQILEGDCSLYGERKLKIFSKFNDVNYSKGVQLTSFKMANLIVLTH